MTSVSYDRALALLCIAAAVVAVLLVRAAPLIALALLLACVAMTAWRILTPRARRAALAFVGLAACAVALSACGTLTSHDAVKVQGIAVNMNANSGVTAGQFSVTVDRAPRFIPQGATQDVVSACGQTDAVDTFSNLNSKATATATSVGASSAGLSAPSVAIATGDEAANGCAAIVAAAATTAHPADVVATALNHTTLPSAPVPSIVRDGVSPSPTAAAAPAAK